MTVLRSGDECRHARAFRKSRQEIWLTPEYLDSEGKSANNCNKLQPTLQLLLIALITLFLFQGKQELLLWILTQKYTTEGFYITMSCLPLVH